MATLAQPSSDDRSPSIPPTPIRRWLAGSEALDGEATPAASPPATVADELADDVPLVAASPAEHVDVGG
eukprot:8211857-Alexandrium_andersonii.AAC.1